VIVPAEVVQEIEAGGRTQFARSEFRSATWLDKRTEPTMFPTFLQAALDPGEAAVISLAMAEKVSTVATDEVVGRRMARMHGLKLTGSLGILLQARQQGLSVTLRPAIASMRRHGIWLGEELEKECLRIAEV
jgi:predicted nucleic acid-binding protein